MPASEPQRTASLSRARLSLEGLSLGDAFGQQFFCPSAALRATMTGTPPLGPWRYTDDTEMAIAIHDMLARHGRIDQDDLAWTFADRYACSMQVTSTSSARSRRMARRNMPGPWTPPKRAIILHD